MQPAAHPRLSFSWPLALWLGLQLLILIPPALQVPLADVYPRPVERLALRHVAAGQIIAASLLFPLVLRSLTSAIAAISATWPFILLAGILSSAQMSQVVACAGYVSAWMTLLALASAIARSRAWQMRLLAMSSMLTLGAAGLMYLRVEFGSSHSESLATILQRTPVFAVIELAGNAGAEIWLPIACGLGLAVVAIGSQYLLNKRQRAAAGAAVAGSEPKHAASGANSQKVGEDKTDANI